MKQISFMLILWAFFAFQTANAQANLIQGSGMEAADESAWSVAPFSTTSPDVTVTWGHNQAPSAGSGNALRIVAAQPAAQVQYAIYQTVTLAAGTPYEMDAAVKVNGTIRECWFQLFVGTLDPTTAGLGDYTVVEGNGVVQLASYFSWASSDATPSAPDGLFSTGANEKPTVFTPETAGTYYVVVKLGCSSPNGHFDVLLDNVSFKEQVMPAASFTVSARSGFAPLTVTFTSTSVRATTHEWTFGDGATSTEANPTHTYNTAGTYSVSLKVTNTYGESAKSETDFITVRPPEVLTGGGKLTGGNMESESPWTINYLNSPAGGEPTAAWNYSGENLPSAGQGGALRLQINSTAGATVQYCLYQKVTLSADKVYRFNGAFRDNSANLWHFWSEVYLADEYSEPQAGTDFVAGTGITQIAAISNWETTAGANVGLDGTYRLNGNAADYIPAASGDYWFVIKLGVNGAFSADVIIDELLLEEVSPKPYTQFTADNNIGFAPLTVQFTSLAKFATSYEWDFGDGSAKATAENPSHTYTDLGTYTVTLKASNAQGDSTVVKTDFVAVNEREALPEGEKLYGGNMENGSFWNKTPLSGDQTKVTLTWNYTGDRPAGGEGGNLRIQIVPHTASASANIAVWQSIEVKQGYVYDFDGLFKDIGAASDNFWVQVFLSASRPNETDGDVFADVDAMARFHSWTTGYTGKLYDGSFKDGAFVGSNFETLGGELCSYHHTSADATLYFVLKVGCNGNNVANVDFLFDNFSLKESVWAPKPKADFVIANPPSVTSTAPYTVEFMDNSTNASKWVWNFGDGSPEVTIEGEEYGDTGHTYTQNGWYSVTLTVYSGHLSDTYTFKDAVQLGPKPSGILQVKAAKQTAGVIDRKINIVSEEALGAVHIYNTGGQTVQLITTQSNAFVSGQLPQGIYIVKAGTQIHKVAVK
jgi:PKD repeat protein